MLFRNPITQEIEFDTDQMNALSLRAQWDALPVRDQFLGQLSAVEFGSERTRKLQRLWSMIEMSELPPPLGFDVLHENWWLGKRAGFCAPGSFFAALSALGIDHADEAEWDTDLTYWLVVDHDHDLEHECDERPVAYNLFTAMRHAELQLVHDKKFVTLLTKPLSAPQDHS